MCLLLVSYGEENMAVLRYKAKNISRPSWRFDCKLCAADWRRQAKTCSALCWQNPCDWWFTIQIQPFSTIYLACNLIPNISFLRTPWIWACAPPYAMERCTHLAKTGKGVDVNVGHVNGVCLDCIQCAGDIHAVRRLAFSQWWESFILVSIGRG